MDFIAAIVTVEAFGDYQLAQYATKNYLPGLFLGYASYAITLLLFIKSIRTMGLAWSNSAWDGWSNLATSLVAIFILKEKPNPHELMGMVLISVGLFLLGTEGTRNAAA
jgi:multidrug transporter EmrE-like cation transporter